MKKVPLYAAVIGILILSSSGFAHAQTGYSPLTQSLSLGAAGEQVSKLQTFLRELPSIYPEALITGYFGTLTMSAVKRFQAQFGIEQVSAEHR